ncbi:MAG TPA: glycosyltransferase, partial [Puia sp.]|nr:glycosyltransferase [Puia sp.]
YEPSSDKPITFLFIGRMIRPKGIVEFAEAARIVQKAGLPARFQALGFFDDNPDAIPRRQMEEWAANGVLTWLGQSDDVAPFIEKADCIVLPSYREGMPMSLLEGASMCKALIAADSPGCRSLVEDGVNGFLCRTKDSADLAKKMIAYLQLPPAAKRKMGLAAREQLTSGFTCEQIAAVYMEKINSLMA